MPGFLSASGYEGVERIDLGGGYWVDVKKCLSSAEATLTEAVMIGDHRMADGGQSARIDARSYRTELVVLSIVRWNLDDDDNTIWPLDAGARFAGRGGGNPYPAGCPRRLSVARLPEPVFEQIFKRCDELNSPRSGPEAAQFPGEDERGDQDGDDSAAGAGPVPDGAGVLAGAGLDPGNAF